MKCCREQYDVPLLKFSATNNSSEPEIEILWENEERAYLLPLELKQTPEGLSWWLWNGKISR